MRNYAYIAVLGASFLGLPLVTGCDSGTTTEKSTTTTSPNGATSTDKSKTTTDANGASKTTTEHQSTTP